MFKGDLRAISSHIKLWEAFAAEQCSKPRWGKTLARPLKLILHT